MTSESKRKIGLLGAFIESCINIGFYTRAFRASWLKVAIYAFLLVILTSVAYSIAANNLIKSKLESLFKDLPTITLQNGEASWDPQIKTPYIKKFPPSGGRRLSYIIDSGEKRAALEESSDMYALFTKKEIILNDGSNRKVLPVQKLEADPALKSMFFGDPFTISPGNLAKFVAFYTSIVLGTLFFFLPLLFLFPLFNLLTSVIVSIAGKWNLNFSEIYKLSFFAATPAFLIQAACCFFLVMNWSVFLIGILVSWAIQIAYLFTGLKACKHVSSGSL